jgi:TRAP-type C4-dicarboxylate transport system permease small subunit
MSEPGKQVLAEILIWWLALVVVTALVAFALGALTAMTGFAPASMLRSAGAWSYVALPVGAAGYIVLLAGAVVRTIRLTAAITASAVAKVRQSP